MKKILPELLFLSLFLVKYSLAMAEEGMWLPALLDKLNITAMQAKGLKLGAEDIYSINKACLKDAVVVFGSGCTAELVSAEGLLLTNHHCGLSQIQSHSSLQNDLVTNGYWAKSRDEELPNPGLTVTFLIRMEDVTNTVLAGVKEEMAIEERDKLVKNNSNRIEAFAVAGNKYKAIVRPLYYGNQYFLFVYQEYRDIRLVAAPPESIGKFGGDTDNWMWPRHTGDFSIFRIYAGKNNEPADYSMDNLPFKPKKFLSISLKGIKEGDFTMVLGYPGRTQQFLTSHAVRNMIDVDLPARISIRDKILENMSGAMQQNDSLRLAYTARYYGISNAWKKWKGTVQGLKRTGALEKKFAFEGKFQQWADSDPVRKYKYGHILMRLDSLYSSVDNYLIPVAYYEEAISSLNLWPIVSRFMAYVSNNGPFNNAQSKDSSAEALHSYVEGFFLSYNAGLSRNTMKAMVSLYFKNVDPSFFPDIFSEINGKFKGDANKYVDFLLNKSCLTDRKKAISLSEMTADKLAKKIQKDPAYRFFTSFRKLYADKIQSDYTNLNGHIADLYRIYLKGIKEMQDDRKFYPDANSTLRVTYGKVENYRPGDAVQFDYSTTLDGVMEKEDPGVFDYKVPAKLHQLYQLKDFGRYGVNGTMPVCFIASNHTSGGNSGSPVLDAEGNLIGINFDRNWEGTMSDVIYDPSICRNISVDIRYVLFIIDKYTGAQNLIDEMTIVQ